jgi:hypothetical protein
VVFSQLSRSRMKGPVSSLYRIDTVSITTVTGSDQASCVAV